MAVSTRGLWTGILIGPLAAMFNLGLNYVIADTTCTPGARALMHVVALGCLALTGGGFVLSWELWRSTGGGWPSDGPEPERSRFMGLWGTLANLLFLFVVIAQWIPVLLLQPCQK
jgi:hypothetical protein